MNWFNLMKTSMQSNEHLKSLLDERYPSVGPEKKTALQNGIVLYQDPYGSYRFVKQVNGLNVSAIQVMKRDGGPASVANAYTLERFRRKGFATELNSVASQMLGQIGHSRDLSGDGEAFVKSLGEQK